MRPHQAFRLLGQKTVESLRRVFLQLTPCAVGHKSDLDISKPNITYFSLADSLNVLPGSLESRLFYFQNVQNAPALIPKIVCGESPLFNVKSSMPTANSGVVDGLTIKQPLVLDGAVARHPVTSNQMLFSLQHGGHVYQSGFSFSCAVQMPIDKRELRLFAKRVFLADTVIERGKVLQCKIGAKSFGKLKAPLVPESIEARIPVIRMRAHGPTLNDPLELFAWAAEKKLLAAAVGNGTTESDIQIIGVFRKVPVNNISRIEIGQGAGNLCIFLRPKCGNVVQSCNRPMFSIAFGRVRGKNEVVRVLVPE